MKKLFVTLMSFAFFSANAQTVDEVIQKYAITMGGLEAFNKVTTAKITGTLTTQGNVLPFTTQIVNTKAMRTDVAAMGKEVINAYDNGKGWKINPLAGIITATEVTGNELVTLKAQASLANNLMDYKNRGHQVELLGQQDVDSVKAFKIKLTNKEDGKLTTYYISTINYLLIKSITKREIAGSEYDAETFYTDIKEINGLKFCMHFTQKIEGKILQEVTYQKIDLNTPVDEKIFKLPK